MKEISINPRPKVSIVILNWNGKKDSIECLESLKSISCENLEIIVVDNGSSDGSQEYIEKNYPHIILIKNKTNLGFTGGNNVGIKKAIEHGAEYIFLLNNDTTVDAHFITACLKSFATTPSVGLVGPKVVYYSNPANVWCAGCYYNQLMGRSVMYGTFSKKKDFEKAETVDWISFCAVMIKREVFEKIGYLDDDFFSSYEDLDFCLRAKNAGFLCQYTPQTIVKHKIAQDWGGLDSPLYTYYQTRNALLCMQKNRSTLGFMIFFMLYVGISIQKRSYRFFLKGAANNIKYIYMGLYDFLLRRYQKGILSEKIRQEAIAKKKLQFPLRIGINTRYLQRRMSGIERYIQELIFNLAKIDTTHNYILFFNKDTPLPPTPIAKNFSTMISKFPTNQRWLRLIWEHMYLRYEIKKNNLSLFHGPAFFVPIWKPRACKYVITVHDIAFIKYPKTFTFSTQLYYKLLFSRSLKLADMIITDSESTKYDIMQNYFIEEDKIKVIYLGVSDVFFKRQKPQDILNIKKKYKLPEKYFLFTGVLSPRKNLIRILKAFSILKQEKAYNKYKLIIVGRKGWLYEGIFTQVKKLCLQDEVSFIDHIPEEHFSVLYHCAEIYLFPSLYEGFGLPILEAMACGCPVITSNVSSMPEVAGDAALLINPTNIQELIQVIKTICEDKTLQKQLRAKGFKQVKKFSWKKTAEETIQVYSSLLEKK